jgi:predicted secreted protein
MSAIAESGEPAKGLGAEEPAATERRIVRGMCAAVVLAVVISAFVAPWRVTTGLLLGGLLSLLNYHWLRTSAEAFLGTAATGARPKRRVARYVLRYAVVACVVFAAYELDAVSLTATLAGLCAFVPAALVEGFTQLYFAVTRREET